MANVKSPLMSQDATGRMPGGLQVGHWMGRHVIGRRRRPRQPRTEAQRATRIWMTFLGREWKLASIAEKASWRAYLPEASLPPYQKFLKYNFNQLKRFQGDEVWPNVTPECPSMVWPPDLTQYASSNNPIAPVPGPGTATFGAKLLTTSQNWLILWFHTYPTGPWCRYSALIGVTRAPAAGDYFLTISNLPATIYYAGYHCVSRGGRHRGNAYYRATTPT